jgi:hypothetical protein
MQGRQFGNGTRAAGGGCRRQFVYEAFEQYVHGNTLPAGFVGEAYFGLTRDFDTYGALLL